MNRNLLSRRAFVLGATAPLLLASTRTARAAELMPPDAEPAPEFAGIERWLNSEPLTLWNLRGKVVLLDFWTYSCINCVRTLPTLVRWHNELRDKGLVIVGIHTPEFAFERRAENVQAALQRFGISYPVALDNQYATWRAYRNQYWPAAYLVGKEGWIVYRHSGEGVYDRTERAIRMQLADGPASAMDTL